MKRLSLLFLMILFAAALSALADDPPPGTVLQAKYLRPCLNTGALRTDRFDYKCTEMESNVGVYHFYTRREYLKDAVYRVDRTPITQTEFVAFAVKQKTDVTRIEPADDTVALVYQRKVTGPVVDPPSVKQWTYKKKE